MTIYEIHRVLSDSGAYHWIVVGVIAVGILAVTILPRRRQYRPRQVLTNNELEFWHRLNTALPDYTVLAQVAMSALIEPAVDRKHRRYMQIRRNFAGKYVDFVVCKADDLEVVAIVELDDRTHDPQADAARDAMLNQAGYAVVRWESSRRPKPAEIASTIAAIKR